MAILQHNYNHYHKTTINAMSSNIFILIEIKRPGNYLRSSQSI